MVDVRAPGWFDPLRNHEYSKQPGCDPTKPASAIVAGRKRVDLGLQPAPITQVSASSNP
jgi:hypothetical protein